MSDKDGQSGGIVNGIVQYVQKRIPNTGLIITLSGLIGISAGFGATVFTLLIEFVSRWTVEPFMEHGVGLSYAVVAVPALGLLIVSWFTRRFAPEAQGHGVPEVIMAVARNDGRIRPQVSAVKILASAMCIGTGGSVGREGPIVQIGSSLGSFTAQLFRLPVSGIKVLVASGAAAGISATFNAPLAGVIFASEIILGSFAVESLTPIVIASVLANVVQKRIGEYGLNAAFPQLYYRYVGSWSQLPTYLVLGCLAGIAAVLFIKFLYWMEDFGGKRIKDYRVRAVTMGLIVGVVGILYPMMPPNLSETESKGQLFHTPALFGVGYTVVDHSLHLDTLDANEQETSNLPSGRSKVVRMDRSAMMKELLWLLPLVFLKPVLTSITLSGGGSGGIFAPSLFLGATLGGSFGLICNLLLPGISASPGVYAIVGMGAVVAGTTQGVLSAILIVYELTNDYHIILPIMAAAGLSSIVAQSIDPESIYHKKISRRGFRLARGHDMHRMEHVMVRDVMIRDFPVLKQTDNLERIVRVARSNIHIESLPVMNASGQMVGLIRSEDLHRVLDTDVGADWVNADDIAVPVAAAISPNLNLLEALRDFGARDIETLPVEENRDGKKQLVGLLLRNDVMRRYRAEMLRMH